MFLLTAAQAATIRATYKQRGELGGRGVASAVSALLIEIFPDRRKSQGPRLDCVEL